MWTMAARAGKRSAVDVETSYFDVDTNGDVTTTGVVAVVNAMPQGTEFDERIGNQTVMEYLDWTLRVSNEAAVTAGKFQTMRLMFVYDEQPNLALAAITDILDAATPNSFYNLGNQDRFMVLQDKLLILNPAGLETLTVAGIYDQTFKGTVDLRGLGSRFSDGQGRIESMTTGALLMVQLGTTAAGTTDWDAICKTRLAYYS